MSDDATPLLKGGEPSQKLTLGTKLAFGAGACPSALANTIIGFYFSAFLLEVAGVRPSTVTIVLLLGRVYDAIMDPLVGFFTSRTHTRFGHLRPWIGASAIPFAVSYVMLWNVPDLDQTGKVLYYIFVFLIYQTLFSSYHMPYTALTVHLSNDPVERDSATSVRVVFEVICVLFSTIFQGLVVSGVKEEGDGWCRNCTATVETENPVTESLRRGYMVSAGSLAVIMAITALIVFVFVKEQAAPRNQPQQTFLQGLKTTVTTRSYLMLTLLYVWVWMGVQAGQSNYILWFKYSIDRENDYQQVLIVLLLTTLLAVPCWFLILRRCGKRWSYAIGLLMGVPSTLFLYFAPRHCPLWLLHVNSIWSGFSLSSVYLLPWTMLPDVIDADELLTGVRKESLFYAFFVFFQKFAAGIAVGLTTLALELAGYMSEPCCGENQPDSVDSTLRLMMGILPLPLNALSLLFTYWYPITVESQKLTKARLAEIRAEQQRGEQSLALEDSRKSYKTEHTA